MKKLNYPRGKVRAQVSKVRVKTELTTADEMAEVLDFDEKIFSLPDADVAPVNAVEAQGLVTFTDDVTQGELLVIGADTYEVDIDAAGVTEGNIPITLASGAITQEDSGTALTTAMVASGTEDISAGDVGDGTVTLTADVAGVSGNLTALLATGAHVAVDAAFMGNTVIGVDGTVGVKNQILMTTSALYFASLTNTVADANWRKIAFTSL